VEFKPIPVLIPAGGMNYGLPMSRDFMYIYPLFIGFLAVKSRYIASSVKTPWQVQRRRDYARHCAIEQL
jgi:hypothetical protein